MLSLDKRPGVAGGANTGNGGSGGAGNTQAGSNGGSGIVIIKYLTPSNAAWFLL